MYSQKRTSGQAFLAERDKASKEKEEVIRKRRLKTGGSLVEAAPYKVDFDPLLSSQCKGGRVKVLGQAEEAEEHKWPKCTWWQLEGGPGPKPLALANKGLDLAKVSKDVLLLALVAETPTEGSSSVREEDHSRLLSEEIDVHPWRVVVSERSADKSQCDLVRVRRIEGLQKGGAWFVALLVKTVGDAPTWSIQAVDEIYPLSRLRALLPMRCKELAPETAEAQGKTAEAELSPGEQARRMLEEAMKNM